MSIFFDVLKAITDMRAEDMPSAHRLILVMVANHANTQHRSWPSIGLLHEETGYGRTKIAEVLDDLVRFEWLRPDGREGRGLKSAARFEVTVGRAWPADSRAKLARPVTALQAGLHRPPGEQACPPGEQPPAIRPADHGDPPIVVRRADHRDPPGGHKPPKNFLFEPPIEDPRIKRSDRGGTDDLPLFGGSSGAAPTTIPEPRGRRRREKKPKLEPVVRAEDRYADAYQRAHADAGFPVTALTPGEKKRLGPIAATHARYRDGTAITGDELVQWFYRRARAFRRDVPDPSRHRGGASPFGFGAWLDNGADGEERPLAPGQEEEPPASDPELRDERPVPLEWQPSPEAVAREREQLERFVRRPAHG